MKLGTLLVIDGAVGVVFGIAFVLAPAQVLSAYGTTLGAAGLFMTRLFGAALIQIGALALLARNVADASAQRTIVLAYFIALVIGFVVALQGQLAGIANALGWSTVVLYLLLALGFGYSSLRSLGFREDTCDPWAGGAERFR